MEYFRYDPEQVRMIVNFSKLFPGFSGVYERFIISTHLKRTTYKKIAHEIARTSNECLNFKAIIKEKISEDSEKVIRLNHKREVANTFMYGYLALKKDIDTREDILKMPKEVVIAEVLNLLSDDLMGLVTKYVDKCYEGQSMDEVIDARTQKYEDGTTLRDKDIKIILSIKVASNLLVPLMMHYAAEKVHEINTNDLMVMFYKAVFRKISDRHGVDLLSKIHYIVGNLSDKSYNANKKMYNIIAINGITIESLREKIFNTVLTNIIPKLQMSHTVPSYIAQTVKFISGNHIPREMHKFSIYNFTDREIPGSNSGDSIVTEAERVESTVKRENLSNKIVFSTFVDDTIDKIARRYNVSMTSNPHALNYVKMNNIPHKFQTHILTMMFLKEFGGTDNIYTLSIDPYNKLVYLASEILKKRGLKIISDYVLSKYDKLSLSVKFTKSSTKYVINHPKYQEMIDTVYRNVKEMFKDKNFFIDDSVALICGVYINNTLGARNFGYEIKYGDEEIIDAVFRFYESL